MIPIRAWVSIYVLMMIFKRRSESGRFCFVIFFALLSGCPFVGRPFFHLGIWGPVKSLELFAISGGLWRRLSGKLGFLAGNLLC